MTPNHRQPSQVRSWHWPTPTRSAPLALALALAALVSGSAGAQATTLTQVTSIPAHYRSLYGGLDHSRVSPPRLFASTSLALVERRFPPGVAAVPPSPTATAGGELYIGFPLAPLSCRDDYLAKVTLGPGAVLTLAVLQHRLPPGAACFQLIGPLMYQVIALPLEQFPSHLRLAVVLRRPPGAGDARELVRLP